MARRTGAGKEVSCIGAVAARSVDRDDREEEYGSGSMPISLLFSISSGAPNHDMISRCILEGLSDHIAESRLALARLLPDLRLGTFLRR